MSDSIEASELFKRIEAEHPVEDWALAKLRVMAMSSIPVIDKAFTDLKEENKRLREALEEIAASACIDDAYIVATEALKEE